MTFRVRIANGLIRALNSWLIDLALMKTTKITERVDMEFGVQFFNIFNHVQLGDPGTDNLALNYTNVPDSAGNPTNQYIVSPVGKSRSDHQHQQFQQPKRQRRLAEHGHGFAQADSIHASRKVLV